MELIKALEQLSLEVKSKQNFGTQNRTSDWRRPTNESMTKYNSGPLNQTNQYPDQPDRPEAPQSRLRHLEEFDNSIDTLFAQLSEFDPADLQPNHHQKPMTLGASARRWQFHDRRVGLTANQQPGSMETSQEEDSDCSSQQSGQLSSSTSVCPLVRDLLQRDLSAITDTVRKISRILALGKEIESVYNHLTMSRDDVDSQRSRTSSTTTYDQLCPDYQLGRSLNQANQARVIDPTYLRCLCDNYTSLYLSEPHIANLQTMLRYNGSCQRLMSLLGCQSNYQEDHMENVEMDSDYVKGEDDADREDEEENELFEDEVAFLDCDPRRMDNWTENKLYVNHQ